MIALLLVACSTEQAAPPPLPTGFHPTRIGELKNEIASPQRKARIYNFWATWCAPCMRELPELKAVAESRDDVDLVLVNVDMASLHDSKVKATLTRMELDAFRSLGLVDPDPAYALGQLDEWPNSVPVTMVVDAAGTRTQQFNVAVNQAQLVKALDALAP